MLVRIVFFAFLAIYPITVYAQAIVDIPESEPSEDIPEKAIAVPPQPKNTPPTKPQKTNKTTEKLPEKPVAEAVRPNVVVLQGLNKVLGRISTIKVPLGTMARFENLEIIAHKCQKSLPEEHPDNKSLLEIREIKTDEEPKQIFLGWMFSSSPSLSGLEHPVYDITVISCEARKDLEGLENLGGKN